MEVLRQAFTGFAESLGARVGRDVNCENGQEIAAPPPDVSLFAVDLTLAPRPLPAFWLGVAPNLLEVIEKLGSRGAAAEPSALPAAAPAVLRPGVKQNPKALELLLEVELPVSVSFGRTQLPLKDVLKLTTGSIVELNRMVNEPVEVIVNNCVIARGEVVVIEGNYGVRIHEIISRQERLRSLT